MRFGTQPGGYDTGVVEDKTAGWDLPRDITAGAAARRHVADFLSPSDPATLRESCELVASELAVNAVRHGHPPARMSLRREGHGIRIEVTSGLGTARPEFGALEALDPESPNGRGLAIAARLADDIGWTEIDGRITVWADISG
jgi:anti-sigma regulatory factor (Ser/Thr protein kinase)